MEHMTATGDEVMEALRELAVKAGELRDARARFEHLITLRDAQIDQRREVEKDRHV